MSIITTILCTPNSNVEYNFFTSPIFSGLLSGMIGAGIAFLTAHLIANRTDKKEIRNKLIALNANLSAFEYIILALAHDYILAGYAYAYSFTKERLTGINASSTMKADRVESARDKFELNMFEFRKYISEIKSYCNENERNNIDKYMLPFIKEEFYKWNLLYNKMKTKEEFDEFNNKNNHDSFGQGGESIEPDATIKQTKANYVKHLHLISKIVDNKIKKLLPKSKN